MKHFQNELHLRIGLVLILISSGLYFFEYRYFEPVGAPGDGPFTSLFSVAFFFHYGLAMFYFVVLWKTVGWRRFFSLFGKDTRAGHTLLLVLFNIGAYSLNRTLHIFYESADWLTAFLILENVFLVVFSLLKAPPRPVTVGASFLFGAALLFHIYQTLMILPYMVFGILGAVLIGISLHLFVPLFYVGGLVAHLRSYPWTAAHRWAFGLSLTLSAGAVAWHVAEWRAIENELEAHKLMLDAPGKQPDLPGWVTIAQQMPESPLLEQYLKAGLVYQEFTRYTDSFLSSVTPFSEGPLLHDPLVAISSLFTQNDLLDEKTRIRVLNYLYDARHQSADRFWSGENLESTQVVTNAELFPAHRLSFTELIITVTNRRAGGSRWGQQQEALYTFQLPEGGVVTSLSLWIGGREEKAALTSKKKAEKAYNTIVGRELRDPSVVYWMEGHKVRVRVFPCTPDEDRKFKIGITAPLRADGGELHYQSVTFQGPDPARARSAIYVVTHGAAITHSTVELKESNGLLSRQGDYVPGWGLSISASPIDRSAFTYRGEHYRVVPHETATGHFDPEVVYLDVSDQWTRDELTAVTQVLKGKKVYVNTTRLAPLAQGKAPAQEALPGFTLFPFHEIAAPQQALVITKGNTLTPNLSDLEGTDFRDRLFAYFHDQQTPVRMVDIAGTPSDYIRSLKEFGVIDYRKCSLDELESFIAARQFPSASRDSLAVPIPMAGISIVKAPAGGSASAPDHLMRLFCYQKIMDRIGNRYFAESANEYLEDELVALATRANVVTPLSSLVVLETKQDYERFGITHSKDSLGNATINSSGAVPEPHEWALIITGALLLLYLYWKSIRKTARA